MTGGLCKGFWPSRRWLPWAVISLALVSACSPTTQPLISIPPNRASRADATQDKDFAATSYQAADAMLGNLQNYLDPHMPIVAATFVDLNDLKSASPLGRLLSRQVASRLTQRGFTVTEMKMRKEILIQPGLGELLLSRELKELQEIQNVQAALVGNYAVGRDTIYVTTQLVRVVDGGILASHDFTLPMGANTRALINPMRPPLGR